MRGRECLAFRRAFEPGLRGPHFGNCLACREWALEVESWRALGAKPALPHPLRTRLLAIPKTASANPAEPLPPALRARLLRIPSAERARHRVVKARYAVAASYLLAGLFTLTTGGGQITHAPSARGLAEAGARGTELLSDVGGWIVAGCGRANDTLERFFGRLGSSPVGPRNPADPETQKEEDDGTRKAP